MDTPSSGFITALEHFWNDWAAHRSNLMFIVCGSATSYIIDNVINNTGGLVQPHHSSDVDIPFHPV